MILPAHFAEHPEDRIICCNSLRSQKASAASAGIARKLRKERRELHLRIQDQIRPLCGRLLQ